MRKIILTGLFLVMALGVGFNSARDNAALAADPVTGGTIEYCYNSATISYDLYKRDLRSIQPYMGRIVGYLKGGSLTRYNSNGYVNIGSLYEITYLIFPPFVGVHDQAKYAGNRAVGSDSSY